MGVSILTACLARPYMVLEIRPAKAFAQRGRAGTDRHRKYRQFCSVRWRDDFQGLLTARPTSRQRAAW